MATTWPWADLTLQPWSKERIWECFWLSEVALLVSPSSILPLPGYEWLNWEVIDAGCQVALEECHRNASCQWFEWPWRPCCSLSKRPHPNRCPDIPASLNSTTPFLASKTCQSGSQQMSSWMGCFWKSPRVLLANGMKHTDMSNSHLSRLWIAFRLSKFLTHLFSTYFVPQSFAVTSIH